MAWEGCADNILDGEALVFDHGGGLLDCGGCWDCSVVVVEYVGYEGYEECEGIGDGTISQLGRLLEEECEWWEGGWEISTG